MSLKSISLPKEIIEDLVAVHLQAMSAVAKKDDVEVELKSMTNDVVYFELRTRPTEVAPVRKAVKYTKVNG